MPGAALSAVRLRQQRRGWGLLQHRLAAGGQVLQHIPPLLAAVATTLRMVATNRLPPGLLVPWLTDRQSTGGHNARSAAMLDHSGGASVRRASSKASRRALWSSLGWVAGRGR